MDGEFTIGPRLTGADHSENLTATGVGVRAGGGGVGVGGAGVLVEVGRGVAVGGAGVLVVVGAGVTVAAGRVGVGAIGVEVAGTGVGVAPLLQAANMGVMASKAPKIARAPGFFIAQPFDQPRGQ